MKARNDFALISRYKTQLMGIAALMIYIFHQWEHQWIRPGFSLPFLDFSFNFVQRIAFFGVDIFFLLSGMGLIYSIEKHSVPQFYLRRIERIYPPFLLSGLLQMLLFGWGITVFLKKVLLYDFFFVSTGGFLWFVPAIILFYLLFPLYYRFFSKSESGTRFTVTALFIWLVASIGMTGLLREDFYNVSNRIPIFLTGIWLGWFIKEKAFVMKLHHWLILVLSFLLGLYLAYMTNYRELYLLVPSSNCAVPTFLLSFPAAFFFAKLLSLLEGRGVFRFVKAFFSFFGKISLELYCMHEFLDDLIRPRLSVSQEFVASYGWVINLAVFLCAVLAALCLSYICRGLLSLCHRLPRKNT